MRGARALWIAQALLFSAWATWESFDTSRGTLVHLRLAPVDPRDLVVGQYMALRFDLGDPPGAAGRNPGTTYLRLEPQGSVETPAGPRPVYRAVEIASDDPKGRHGIWVRARRTVAGGPVQLGIERFFISEDRPDRMAPGAYVAEVRVGRGGRAHLVDLVPVSVEATPSPPATATRTPALPR